MSLNTSLVYQQQQEQQQQQQQQKTQDTSAAASPPSHDEVEDLYLAQRWMGRVICSFVPVMPNPKTTTALHLQRLQEQAVESDSIQATSIAAKTVPGPIAFADMALEPHNTQPRFLVHINRLHGGLLHVSEIMSPEPAQQAEHSPETDLAVMEAMDVLATLDRTLHWHGCTVADVVMVHLYLSEISHFQRINEHYRNFFGDLLPPSHSCVMVSKPLGRQVLLDGLVQQGSGFVHGHIGGIWQLLVHVVSPPCRRQRQS